MRRCLMFVLLSMLIGLFACGKGGKFNVHNWADNKYYSVTYVKEPELIQIMRLHKEYEIVSYERLKLPNGAWDDWGKPMHDYTSSRITNEIWAKMWEKYKVTPLVTAGYVFFPKSHFVQENRDYIITYICFTVETITEIE